MRPVANIVAEVATGRLVTVLAACCWLSFMLGAGVLVEGVRLIGAVAASWGSRWGSREELCCALLPACCC